MPKRTIAFSAMIGALVLTGCQSFDGKPWYDPLNLQVEMEPHEPKSVVVAPSEFSFTVRFAQGAGTVSDAERKSAVGFLTRRASAPSDEVLVDFGLFHETTGLAHERRTTVAEIATGAGLDPARIKVRANVAGIAENEVNLTVRRYFVTLPGCPDFTDYAGRSFDNQPHSNWGCANAQNLGLMVAEPKDLIEGRGATPGDAEALVLSVQRYRAGATRPLDVGATNTAESFGQEGSSGGAGGGGGQ